MKTQAWKVTGLTLAVMGALTLAQAAEDTGTQKKGERPRREGRPDADVSKGRPGRDEAMKRFDKDGDGQLNDEERAAARKAMGERQGRGDPAGREEAMKKFDKDGDGQLNEEERAAARKAMGERQGRGGPGGREEMMKKFDKDGDGELNDEERAEMRKEFEKRRAQRPPQSDQ